MMDSIQTSTQKNPNTILYIVIAVLLVLGIVYAVFQDDIQDFGKGLERVGERQENYKKENPNATKQEMDNAFNDGINSLQKWSDDYKADHPGASDADVEKAWNDAWGK